MPSTRLVDMNTLSKVLACAAIAAAGVTTTMGAGQAALLHFTGRVDHVSTDNIKVTNARGATMSFMVLPHFDQVFQFDGKTTYQMKRLKPGMLVNVSYDERALGIRHADRIVLMRRPGVVVHG